MAPAWLDSLSEDWVSQPGSDTSFAAALPSVRASPKDVKNQKTAQTPPSRIPRANYGIKNSHTVPNENSSHILSERSVNEMIAPASYPPQLSKLSREIKLEGRGRQVSRSFSSGSVVHNTVNYKSMSASPSRRQHETPEWKRRLVYGDLSYGEQPDLFTSAATGLENIFKPPPPAPDPPTRRQEAAEEEPISQYEVTLPSSPPQYPMDPSTVEIHVDDSVQDVSAMPETRAKTSMRYRRNDDSAEGGSRESDQSLGGDSYSEWPSVDETALSPPNQNGSEAQSRKVSGQSVVRNEDFSPILLERRQASNGEVGYGPSDLPPDELRKRLEKLRRNQMVLAADTSAVAIDGAPSAGHAETTNDYEDLGGFINFRRGGRSEDGSFRHHMLSSALNDTSELHPEESLQASTPKQFPTVRVEQWRGDKHFPTESPDYPRPPDPSPEKKASLQLGASGSPLKLFQPYDTFTNQTLLRRLSQFEGNAADETPSRVHQTGERVYHNEESSYIASPPRSPTRRENGQGRNISQFGVGELDGYVFDDDFSYDYNGDSLLDGNKENCGPDGDSVHLPRAPIFTLSRNSSPDESDDLVVRRSRQKPMTPFSARRAGKTEGSSLRIGTHINFPVAPDAVSTPVRGDLSEIKRPRTSPSKDPTPKRRRTLHKSDVGYETLDQSQLVDTVQVSHLQMQSANTGQDNSEDGDEYELEGQGQGMLAPRDIARPRTPTPNQRSSVQRDRPPLAEIEQSPTRASRHGKSAVPLPLRSVIESERKPSIRTEDFINEANKIMAMIRSKAGVASGLASLEESDAEHRPQPSPDRESSYQSTEEPFSRPPSREGRPPIARISARQEDPELVERLKKYEEASDMGDVIGSSMRSNALSNGALSSTKEGSGDMGNRVGSNNSWPSSIDDNVISDPPNIRLSRNPDRVEGEFDAVPSHASTGSGQSTGRSYPTGSSRGSENRKRIAPESVEHLIPDKVGNMVLDRQRNIWIKRKSGSSSGSSKSRNFLPSEASEDDPFADIPDLSVDMTMELRNLMATRAENAAKLRLAEQNAAASAGTSQTPSMNSARRPVLIPAPISSPTRGQDPLPSPSVVQSTPRKLDDEAVEHEIAIHEDRVSATKRRNLTISFSSPLASIIQDVIDERDESDEESSALDQTFEDISRESIKRGRRIISIQTKVKNGTSRSRSDSRGPTRHLSVRGRTLMARPISRIDEREEESNFEKARNRQQATNMELSIIAGSSSTLSHDADGARQTSLSFVVATPARPRDCPAEEEDAAPIISQYVGTFSLSPLSEFTVHEGEDSLPLEASYIVGNHRLITGDRSKRVMSLNTRNLVEKLAEVEPFEPYWEDMKDLRLCNRRLGSLHSLEEFCNHLESLDVSNNEIRNLNGIPSSVRQLKMNNNQLSGLTAWGHLMNLQYLDISNNGLTSLAPFKSLVHLRSLRVDNNQLTSLDGIKFHDGLQSLRARGNAIQELDFESNRLDHLTELDLKNNKITHVTGLEHLPSLSSLNLENNDLESFTINPSSETPLDSLRYLRLDDNKISTLDIKMLPHLRLLHADRNRLMRIDGFSRARKVDSLSLREQAGSAPLDLPHLLSRAYEVRKLYLSGNYFGGDDSSSTFAPTVDFLNLQLLELANCGLVSLPDNLGLMMPNLRVLNLNLNALSDLSPLEGIPRLKRVFVSGNRLRDCAGLVRVLSGFGHLSAVDVRDNPVTVGFYAPLMGGVLPPSCAGDDGGSGVVVRSRPGSSASGAGSEVMRKVTGEDGEMDGEAEKDCASTTSSRVHQEKDKESAVVDPFTLPNQDPVRDATYCKRLDMETRIRRRVFEQMFVGCCKRLRKLDGLAISRREVAALRDGVWLALAERGLVVGVDGERCRGESVSVSVGGKGGRGRTGSASVSAVSGSGSTVVNGEGEGEGEGEQRGENKGDVTARWGAEDSFGGW